MTTSIWADLEARGVPRTSVEESLRKVLGPPCVIAKPQFREYLIKEVAGVRGQSVTHEETVDYLLIADRIWESWPEVP